MEGLDGGCLLLLLLLLLLLMLLALCASMSFRSEQKTCLFRSARILPKRRDLYKPPPACIQSLPVVKLIARHPIPVLCTAVAHSFAARPSFPTRSTATERSWEEEIF